MKRELLVAVGLLTVVGLWRAWPAQAADEAAIEDRPVYHAPAEDIARWRQLKFGLFIHWGPVSLTGREIGWSRGGVRRGRDGIGETPVEVYDNLYKTFNPTEFDAQEWVRIAQAAGMRYLVFTSRHHDGFSMYDSKLTDYKITSPESPYRRDVVRQLADACHAAGLPFGLYYSQPDWHHPDYRTENHARYLAYLHGQVRELLSNYGRVDMLFFDGLDGSAQDWDAPALFPVIRQLQPHIIVNDRCGVPADNDTPEQRIGAMQTDRPWETCMTICQQWSWKPDDQLKSLDECVRTLVQVVGGDGNLLLNVGPMPDGRIEPRQVERLREIGQWLSQYGESIDNTRGGPFPRGDYGASTFRDNRVYVHILDREASTIELPALPKKIVSHRVLTGGEASVEQTSEAIRLTLPTSTPRPVDTIVVLELESP